MMMTVKSPKSTNRSRSLTGRLGATEWLFLLGLLLLSCGSFFLFGFAWALFISGGILLATAYFNAAQPGD
jgi:hypothetical protein